MPMTHTPSGLERRGLVDIRPNPGDGRSKQVWPTERGRSFRDQARRLLSRDIEALSGKIDTVRIAEILPDLVLIRQVLDAYRDD